MARGVEARTVQPQPVSRSRAEAIVVSALNNALPEPATGKSRAQKTAVTQGIAQEKINPLNALLAHPEVLPADAAAELAEIAPLEQRILMLQNQVLDGEGDTAAAHQELNEALLARDQFGESHRAAAPFLYAVDRLVEAAQRIEQYQVVPGGTQAEPQPSQKTTVTADALQDAAAATAVAVAMENATGGTGEPTRRRAATSIGEAAPLTSPDAEQATPVVNTNGAGSSEDGLAQAAATGLVPALEGAGLIVTSEQRKSAELAGKTVDAAREAVIETQRFLQTNVFGEGNEEMRAFLAEHNPVILNRKKAPATQHKDTPLTPADFDKGGRIGIDAIPGRQSFDVAEAVLKTLSPEQLAPVAEDPSKPLEDRYADRLDHVLSLMVEAAGGYQPRDPEEEPVENVTLPPALVKAINALGPDITEPFAKVYGATDALGIFDNAFHDLDVNHATLNALRDARQRQDATQALAEANMAAAPIAAVATEPVGQSTQPAPDGVDPRLLDDALFAPPVREPGALKNQFANHPAQKPAEPTHTVSASWIRPELDGIARGTHLAHPTTPDELPGHARKLVNRAVAETERALRAYDSSDHLVDINTRVMTAFAQRPWWLRWIPTGRNTSVIVEATTKNNRSTSIGMSEKIDRKAA